MGIEVCLGSGSELDAYMDKWHAYAADHYPKRRVVMVAGDGCTLTDSEGKKCLDATSGYGAVNLGHHHPAIVAAVKQYLDAKKPFVVPNQIGTDNLIDALVAVAKACGYQKFIPMNSGAEAVETALKQARKWGYKVKGVPRDKAVILGCPDCFHGRTHGTIGLSTQEKYRKDFGPYPDSYDWVPFGDADALERTLATYVEYGGDRVVAFIVEPIQGEAGIIVPPADYLKRVKEICKKYNVLFIADEVQTGFGRAGKMLVSEDVHPDMVVVGKTLGAGLTPMSGVLFDSWLSVFEPGEHGSTYAGNAFASAIAIAVVETIEKEQLCGRSVRAGGYLLTELQLALGNNRRVKQVRGAGLMIGIEFAEGVDPSAMAARCIQEGVLTIGGRKAIRVCPPLTVSLDECDEYVRRIAKALNL